MTFGVSVASYNKKPNAYIQKAITPPAPTAPTPTAMSTTTQVPNTAPSGIKSALSGSTAPTASGLVNNVQAPVVQPLFSAQAGNKSDSIYGRLGAINEMTDSQNELSRAKVGAANNRINSWNNRMSQNASTGDFGGIGDSGLDGEQLGYARQIANIGKQRGMSDKGIQIAIMTALAESEMRNISHGDRDSVGLFQQRTSQGWGSIQQIMDPNYSINKFYDSLGKTNYNNMNPWQAAQAVQRSFDPTGSNYQARYSTAMKAYNAIFQPQSNTQSFAGGNSASGWLQSNTNKYIDMDGWYGAQCVDLFNKYTTTFVGGKHKPVGWAPEIINNYDSNVYNRLDRNQTGRMGDVAVFNRGGTTPLGHVSIVIGDNGNGTLRVLSSNYGPGPSGSMNSTVHNISKSQLSGYLRPKMLG